MEPSVPNGKKIFFTDGTYELMEPMSWETGYVIYDALC